jgi:heme-degrading monooxygenase HmoA
MRCTSIWTIGWPIRFGDVEYWLPPFHQEQKPMVIRSWRAIASSQRVVDQYTTHLERTTFKEMARLDGNLGASLSKKPIGDRFELLVLSYWRDMDAVRQFAKGAIDDAVVKPSTQQLLESYDAKVEYFEVCGAAGLLPGQLSPGD